MLSLFQVQFSPNRNWNNDLFSLDSWLKFKDPVVKGNYWVTRDKPRPPHASLMNLCDCHSLVYIISERAIVENLTVTIMQKCMR